MFVDGFCENDGEQAVREISVCSGGQAGNVAAGVSKLGARSFFFGNIGDDVHTQMLLSDLDACGVNYSYAKRNSNPNNSVIVLVDPEGARRLYAYNRVDFCADDLPENLLEKASMIYFSSLVDDKIIDTYVSMAKRAKSHGLKVALDPGQIFACLGVEKLMPLLELCDYFFPSKNEAGLLGGGPSLSETVPHVIVTCGANGVEYYGHGELEKFPAVRVEPVDTTGAGDCFAAAFLYSVLSGSLEKDAIIFATHAAALSITMKGARSMPQRDEIEVFINEQDH